MTIGIIIFSIFFLILALTRLDYALCVLIAALPAYLIRFSIFGLPSTLLELMILTTFTFLKIGYLIIKNERKIILKKLPILFFAKLLL